MKDRMEWAQQQRKRDEERIATMRAKEKELKERKEKEANMAKEFLQELFSLNPEWEERRRHVYQVRPCHSRYNPHVNFGYNCNSKGHSARSETFKLRKRRTSLYLLHYIPNAFSLL